MNTCIVVSYVSPGITDCFYRKCLIKSSLSTALCVYMYVHCVCVWCVHVADTGLYLEPSVSIETVGNEWYLSLIHFHTPCDSIKTAHVHV